MTYVVLGLGSNKGWSGFEPLQLLSFACVELKKLFVSDFKVSSVYSTRPMYVEDQCDFHNMCVAGHSELTAPEILAEIHKIEAKLGRNRAEEIRNGPRSIDIDIELFGKEQINIINSEDSMKNLQVPHPRLKERAFVLIPMLEILPKNAEVFKVDLFAEYLSETGSQGVKKLLDSTAFFNLIKKQAEKSGAEYGKSDKCRSADIDS